jgi:hypothetical protein
VLKELYNIGLVVYKVYYAREVTVLTYRSVYFDTRVHNPETFGTKAPNTGDIYALIHLTIFVLFENNLVLF